MIITSPLPDPASDDTEQKRQEDARRKDEKESRVWRDRYAEKCYVMHHRDNAISAENSRLRKPRRDTPPLPANVSFAQRDKTQVSMRRAAPPRPKEAQSSDAAASPAQEPVSHDGTASCPASQQSGRPEPGGSRSATPGPASPVKDHGDSAGHASDNPGTTLAPTGFQAFGIPADQEAGPDRPGQQPVHALGNPPSASSVGKGSMSREPTEYEGIADALMATGGNDGIFELIFPDGQTMGVAISSQPGGTHFLLSPSSGTLESLLKQKKMELTGNLQRRIRKPVSITVI